MTAYIDKIEADTLNMRDADGISTQSYADSAQEWANTCNTINEAREIHFAGIRREEDVNEVSKLVQDTATKRAKANRKLLRNAKVYLEEMDGRQQTVVDAKRMVKQCRRMIRG
ncbi:hypothetical protein BC834DRAFT_853214 [Gloeopeniophorella convolvens]|nr:hypothetical protein BC834DRAFT_853214 [Gloeopeniophorella convolvens]